MQKLITNYKILLRIMLTLPSRFLFGNCISFYKNLIPLLQFYFFKKIFLPKTDLEKKGIKYIKYNLTRNIILDTKKHFDILIENPKNIISKSGKQKLIVNPIQLKNLKKITALYDKELLDYFEGNYKYISIKAWRNYPHESSNSDWQKYIYSNYWHFDDYRTDILKIFIILNDNTNKYTGSTKALNITTSKKISRTFRYIDASISNQKLEQYLENKNLINYCDGNLGDIYIINTSRCIHSATIPKKNSVRDLIQLEVTKSSTNNDPFEQMSNLGN
ncbi:hypothetical protein N9X21_03580 [Candidatus Pelagibacter bacterium]|nr:hypothetical protein [Candidatus Pelagibacter bacterium]